MNFQLGEEFVRYNSEGVQRSFAGLIGTTLVDYDSYIVLKRRMLAAIGLIRTPETTRYGSVITESGDPR